MIKRTFNTVKKFEIRSAGKNADYTILDGHAAVFNSRSVEIFGFYEIIKPGAFLSAIERGDDVRALFNHDINYVLGRNTVGTLILEEDEIGLKTEIHAPNTQTIIDLVISPIQRGDISQMSFQFDIPPDGENWYIDENDQVVREVTDLKLYDVSPVTFPAYLETDIDLRSVLGKCPSGKAAIDYYRRGIKFLDEMPFKKVEPKSGDCGEADYKYRENNLKLLGD